MKYFDFVENVDSIFYRAPMEFNMFTSKEILSHSLGATLYMSGLRKDLLNDIQSTSSCSVVICLEDAVATDKLEVAEHNVLNFFKNIDNLTKMNSSFLLDLPLIFLRIRNFEQFKFIINHSSLIGLCGFIFPKFDFENGKAYLQTLKQYNEQNHRNLYCMPILETRNVIYKEHRIENLLKLKGLMDAHRELVLNIRIGGTDFSGIYGLRRDKYHTIYDLAVIKDCIGDIINIFKIDDYVISAPVNEHFDIEQNGFIKEILLDRMNGLIGKTVIHPNQVNIVNALSVISKEDYMDAKSIIASSSDGVIKSIYSNKMNEIKPHLRWAHHIIILSKILGVLNHGKDYRDLIDLEKNTLYKSSFENIIEH